MLYANPPLTSLGPCICLIKSSSDLFPVMPEFRSVSAGLCVDDRRVFVWLLSHLVFGFMMMRDGCKKDNKEHQRISAYFDLAADYHGVFGDPAEHIRGWWSLLSCVSVWDAPGHAIQHTGMLHGLVALWCRWQKMWARERQVLREGFHSPWLVSTPVLLLVTPTEVKRETIILH